MWKRAVFDRANWEVSLMAGLGAGFIAAQLGLGFYSLAPALALFSLTAFILVRSSLKMYAHDEAVRKDATARRWVSEASSPEEHSYREQLFDTHGASAVVAMHGLEVMGPTHNVDGTPMLPGNVGLDINGRLYGAPELVAPIHAHYTGTWHSPADAYMSPYAMDDWSRHGMND